MKLTDKLIKLRHQLHQHPNTAFQESQTAKIVEDFINQYQPDEIIKPIAKTGIAFKFLGAPTKPSICFRADLDALPIQENLNIDYCSKNHGISHKCGHDGHMTMVASIATAIKNIKHRGDVILLFQPAEETGNGAKSVINDDNFKMLKIDYIFGLHNLPETKLGKVLLSDDFFSCASMGLKILIRGDSSHAATPELAKSPYLNIDSLLKNISKLNDSSKESFFLSTLTHLKLGEESFGITPGDLKLFFTIRAATDDNLNSNFNLILSSLKEHFKGFQIEISKEDVFPANNNSKKANSYLVSALDNLNIEYEFLERPIRWSEDFGHYTKTICGSFFGLGIGGEHPLHHQDYNFNDSAIEYGQKIYLELIKVINR